MGTKWKPSERETHPTLNLLSWKGLELPLGILHLTDTHSVVCKLGIYGTITYETHWHKYEVSSSNYDLICNEY
jgi:hypothetical protein